MKPVWVRPSAQAHRPKWPGHPAQCSARTARGGHVRDGRIGTAGARLMVAHTWKGLPLRRHRGMGSRPGKVSGSETHLSGPSLWRWLLARRQRRPNRWRLSSEQQRLRCNPTARGGGGRSEAPLHWRMGAKVAVLTEEARSVVELWHKIDSDGSAPATRAEQADSPTWGSCPGFLLAS
jgi:hypothetical protein